MKKVLVLLAFMVSINRFCYRYNYATGYMLFKPLHFFKTVDLNFVRSYNIVTDPKWLIIKKLRS